MRRLLHSSSPNHGVGTAAAVAAPPKNSVAARARSRPHSQPVRMVQQRPIPAAHSVRPPRPVACPVPTRRPANANWIPGRSNRSRRTGPVRPIATNCLHGLRWMRRPWRPFMNSASAGAMRRRHSRFRSGQCGSSTESGGTESAIDPCLPVRGRESGGVGGHVRWLSRVHMSWRGVIDSMFH